LGVSSSSSSSSTSSTTGTRGGAFGLRGHTHIQNSALKGNREKTAHTGNMQVGGAWGLSGQWAPVDLGMHCALRIMHGDAHR
jgi:hypothetical protein